MTDVTDSSYNNLEYGESQRMAFIGYRSFQKFLMIRNGDVNSYIDFYNAIDNSGVDTTMIARSAIIKPWIFEEIEKRQHIDKSATERLEMLKQFAHWGLEHWVPRLKTTWLMR
jgi:tRNA-dihydrouridine synthase